MCVLGQMTAVGSRDRAVDELFNITQALGFFRCEERDGDTLFACAAGAANAMNLIFCCVREFVIDDMR